MIFVVSEIGVNWDGDYTLLEDMMNLSKSTGCNAVKLQAFNEELVESHPEKSRLMQSAVTQDNVEKINEMARRVKIEWFCTPMYSKAVDFLDPFVKRFKIRENDGQKLIANNQDILFKKIFQTGKEIIISSKNSPKSSNLYGEPKIKWLYCVPEYPCKLNSLDFTHIDDFDGYSNHHPHMIAPLTATVLGASIIEIHVTSDRSKNFVDNNVSFNFGEVKKMIDLIRRIDKIRR